MIITEIKLSKPEISYRTVLNALLFLSPILALGVRHWAGIMFSLLLLSGIVFYFARYRFQPVRLHCYEKRLLWFLLIYFVTFLITMLVHPAESFGRTDFGNEIRFILVIPLYFLLASYSQNLRWLVAGSAVAIIIGFGFCLYEIHIEGKEFFEGVYSRLFAGPMILLYLAVVLTYLIPGTGRKDRKQWILLGILVLMATYCIITSVVRVAYIAYLVLSVMFILFYVRGYKKFLVLGLLVAGLTVVSVSSDSIRSRMELAYTNTLDYFQKKKPEESQLSYAGTSVGVRLEMWRVAPYFLSDYPLMGVGNGNYHRTLERYVKEGKVHPDILLHDHPHNVFLNATYSKGVVGLISTCLVFFYPLFIYIKTYRQSRTTSLYGIFFITLMFMLSMNESAPFNKSNFIGVFLTYGLAIFQNHMAELKRQQSTGRDSVE